MALYFNGKPVFSESGTKSLPWAEYQALSPAEKNNGTIYFITDVNGDGQSFQPVLFSEEEKEIGVWLDGKPLYQKSFVFTSSLTISDNWTSTPFSISDIEKIIDGIIWRVDSSGSVYIDTNKDGNNIRISTKSKNTNFAVGSVLTVRYTKTTDTAGSGTWTPQGVPAHHYSEDEQIVGTWVDGSTLYEKTVYIPSLPNNSTGEYNTGLSNITPISFDDTLIFQSGNTSKAPYTSTNGSVAIAIQFNANGKIFFGTNTDQSLTSAYVTLRYTKSST